MPTEGDLRREAEEARFKKAKTEFLREWINDNFDEFIAATPVDEYLYRHLHVELHELYYQTTDPDDGDA